MDKGDISILDPKTLISRKYFSMVARSNHAIDIQHDTANIFPPIFSLKKPRCKVFSHYRHRLSDAGLADNNALRDISMIYLPNLNRRIPKNESMEEASPSKPNEEVDIDENNVVDKEKPTDKQKIKREEGGDKRKKLAQLRNIYTNFQKDIGFEKYNDLAAKINKAKGRSSHEVVEKSKQLIQGMKKPREIFDSIMHTQQKGPKQIQFQELEKCKKIAKKLDRIVNFDKKDGLSPGDSFLKELPMSYYRKARLNKTEEKEAVARSSTDDVGVFTTQILVSDQVEDPSSDSSRKALNESAPIIVLNAMDDFKAEMTGRRKKTAGLSIVEREKSLFLRPLENYVNRVDHRKISLPVLTEEKVRYNSVQPETRKKESERSERVDKTVWISKVSDIKAQINEFLSREVSNTELLKKYKKRIQRDISKLHINKRLSQGDPLDNEGDYEKGDQEEIVGEVKNRSSNFYALLKNVLGNKAGNKEEGMPFYKKMALKEKRRADQILSGPSLIKKDYKQAGRDIFNQGN